MTVRVRFAPSPTGQLHIGGLRTALFNWLFARHHQGKFLLRIEDTDLERSKPEYTQAFLDAFAWCELDADEPLVIQSERKKEHLKVADRLVAQATAYRCYCTQAELQERLGVNAAHGQGYVHYDGRCRDLRQVLDKPYVIRCKVPRDREFIEFYDLIHGLVRFPTHTIDDFIIIRSDQTPMYNFVVVVDDAFMRITHIIRGEEHLVNTPRQILLYQACGYSLPQFAHIPLILGPDGSKLSKRDAAVAVLDYKKAGFLSDALCNYLVRLGWSHGDQEIFSRQEMINYFTLDHVGKTGAIFDIEKLRWLNSEYMIRATAKELLHDIVHDIDSDFTTKTNLLSEDQLLKFIDLYKTRTKTLVELRDQILLLTSMHIVPNDPFVRAMRDEQWHALDLCIRYLSESGYDREQIEAVFKKVVAQTGLKMVDIAQPIRFALTGTLTAPPVYDLLLAWGKTEGLARLTALQATRT